MLSIDKNKLSKLKKINPKKNIYSAHIHWYHARELWETDGIKYNPKEKLKWKAQKIRTIII